MTLKPIILVSFCLSFDKIFQPACLLCPALLIFFKKKIHPALLLGLLVYQELKSKYFHPRCSNMHNWSPIRSTNL